MSASPVSPAPASDRSRLLARLVLAGAIAWIILSVWFLPGPRPPCETVCSRCDTAIWRAVELNLKDSGLYLRDRIWTLEYPLFPKVFSRGMNLLHSMTADVETSQRIVATLMKLLFITGIFVATQALTGDYLVTALVILLSALSRRMPLTPAPVWGFPHLKPVEFIGASAPWLYFILFRSLCRRGGIELFAVVASLLVYMHPPSALPLLGVGAGLYVWLARGRPGYLASLARSAAICGLLLMPFLRTTLRAAAHGGAPDLAMILSKASYAVFPTRATIFMGLSQLGAPLLAAFLIYPTIKSQLTDLSRRYLLTLGALGALFSLLGALTYVWTVLARLVLPSASRCLYFPVFVILALGMRHSMRFAPRVRPVLWLVCLALAFQLDTRAADWLHKKYYHPGRVSEETDAASAGENERVDSPCALSEAGAWAQNHTGRDALFLVPPEEVDAGFRVLSRRSVVVVDKDGANVKYDRTIGLEWFNRMKDVQEAYRNGTRSVLNEAARRYDAQFILAPRTPGAEVEGAVFANDRWIIWPTDVPVH